MAITSGIDSTDESTDYLSTPSSNSPRGRFELEIGLNSLELDCHVVELLAMTTGPTPSDEV